MHTIRFEEPKRLAEEYSETNAGDRFIKDFFPDNCTLPTLFPDYKDIKRGEYSKFSVHIMSNKQEKFDVRLYRNSQSGRLAIGFFYSDTGDFVDYPQIDCGLPDRYTSEEIEEKTSNLALTYKERLFLSDVLLGYQAMLQYSRQTMFGDALVAVTEQMNKIAALNKKILDVDEQKRNDYMDFITDLNGTVTTEKRKD